MPATPWRFPKTTRRTTAGRALKDDLDVNVPDVGSILVRKRKHYGEHAGFGTRHIEQEHGWSEADRAETENAINNPENDPVADGGGTGNRLVYKKGSRRVIVEVGKKDSQGRPMGLINSFREGQ